MDLRQKAGFSSDPIFMFRIGLENNNNNNNQIDLEVDGLLFPATS